jgi:hypothetical protein
MMLTMLLHVLSAANLFTTLLSLGCGWQTSLSMTAAWSTGLVGVIVAVRARA